jgi:hypothetical protein
MADASICATYLAASGFSAILGFSGLLDDDVK